MDVKLENFLFESLEMVILKYRMKPTTAGGAWLEKTVIKTYTAAGYISMVC